MAEYTPNKYNSTPRKVFDKHVDAMERKRLRDREDHRNDLKAILQQLKDLWTELTLLRQDHDELKDHVLAHCDRIEERTASHNGIEELE